MRTNKRPRRRRRGTARRITASTAITTDHGGHCGHGRPRPNVSDGVTADAANARLANDTVARPIRVNERANGRIERPAPPGTRPRRRRGGSRRGRGHGGHGKHCPSQLSRPPKAERSSAGSRPRRHSDQGAHESQGSLPLVALPLPSTPSHGSHGASQRARTVTACTVGAMGSAPWGARGLADLPGEQAAAGRRGHHIPFPSKA